MPKFFVINEQIENNIIRITDGDAVHINNSLRAKKSENIIVSDLQGNDFLCKIISSSVKEIVLEIIEKCRSDTEPSVKVSIFQGIPKGDKMDLIIQKCVEIGAYEIIPVTMEHSVVKINDKSGKKTERYQKIAEAAAKQSMRGIVPQVTDFMSFEQAVQTAKGLDAAFAAYEKEAGSNATIRQFLSLNSAANGRYATGKSSVGISSIGIFIGPEGGFSEKEINLLKNNNIAAVSLGKRILRTETAGFFTLIILLHELGDF